MILACSTRALERIENAKRSRIAKKDPIPIVVKNKRQVARIRAWLNERAGYEQLVWNLDVDDYPVGGADGELAGYFTCGYVFSGHFRITAILNALDDADLCAIGELARHGIEVVSQDCYATPMACDQLLENAEELTLELFRFLQDEHIIDRLDVTRAGWPSPTIIIPNGNRSAAIGISHVVEMHAAQSARNPTPLSERPEIDRSACYRINGMPVTIRATGKKDYQFPDQFWRASLRERFGHVKHPTVRLRVKLLDGFASSCSTASRPERIASSPPSNRRATATCSCRSMRHSRGCIRSSRKPSTGRTTTYTSSSSSIPTPASCSTGRFATCSA